MKDMYGTIRLSRKQERRKEAEERDAVRAKRSATEQLAELDRRLGFNVGAVKERARLAKENVHVA